MILSSQFFTVLKAFMEKKVKEEREREKSEGREREREKKVKEERGLKSLSSPKDTIDEDEQQFFPSKEDQRRYQIAKKSKRKIDDTID